MNTLEDLLKLKRHEKAPDGFMQDFVAEFHRRQRVLQLAKSQKSFTFSGIKNWMSELGATRWLYAGGLAYASVVAWLLIVPSTESSNSVRGAATPVSFPAVPAKTFTAESIVPEKMGIKPEGKSKGIRVQPTVIPSYGKPF